MTRTLSLGLAGLVLLIAPGTSAAVSITREAGAEPLVGAPLVLSGGAPDGARVVIEADLFPYEGTFEPMAETTADENGHYRVETPLRRNARYRATSPEADPGAVSETIPVVAELGHDVSTSRRVRRKRVAVAIQGPRDAVSGRVVYVYRVREGARGLRRVGRIVMRSLSNRRAEGADRLSLPVTQEDGLFLCMHEARADGYGEHSPLQRRCGRKRLYRLDGPHGLGLDLPELFL